MKVTPASSHPLNVVLRQMADIHPYEGNPRINDEGVQYVANSIKEFGIKQPIVIDKEGTIVAGHTRYAALKKLKWTAEVPCIMADDLSPEQVNAYRLADNKTAEFSDWDLPKLDAELTAIPSLDMSAFGFLEAAGEDSPLDLSGDDDTLEEALASQEPPVTKRGDIYRLGDHRLMCGDSTKQTDVKVLMDGNLADMVFTDPPWNVDYGARGNGTWKVRSILNDSMSTEDFKEFMGASFKAMKQSLTPGGMAYIVMSAQEWGNMMLELTANGMHWSSTIIWNKDQFVMGRKDYHTKYEPIWYGWEDSQPRRHPLADRDQCDVWDFPRPKNSELHPTMKPVELVARAVENSSDEGERVLDLFGGSGTTLMACEQTGRLNYTMELDPHYCDVIVKRWEGATGQKAKLIAHGHSDDPSEVPSLQDDLQEEAEHPQTEEEDSTDTDNVQ